MGEVIKLLPRKHADEYGARDGLSEEERRLLDRLAQLDMRAKADVTTLLRLPEGDRAAVLELLLRVPREICARALLSLLPMMLTE